MLVYPVQDTDVPIPALTRIGGKYNALFELLVQANGEWTAIDPSVIAGATNKRKTITLHTQAAERNLKVRTRHQNGWMYACLVVSQ